LAKSAKSHKSQTFQGTPLECLKRDGKTLAAPTKQLGNISFSSWVNEALADVLWSVLIAGLIGREKALATFRTILRACSENKDSLDKRLLSHSQLASLDPAAFDRIFGPACSDDEIRSALASLLVFETLPDRNHWERLIPQRPKWAEVFENLCTAVAKSFNHQSQEATDCRWVRVMTLVAEDRLVLPKGMEERFDELNYYPNRGDQRMVRPFIRATEMSMRSFSTEGDGAPPWAEQFWAECWDSTHCIPADEDRLECGSDYEELRTQLVSLHQSLIAHFLNTITTTAIDARHDAAFGIVFYIIQMLIYAMAGSFGQTIACRPILRTALEAYITLCFLAKKDDHTIWMQYRNYGNGQSKLAYLKNVSVSDVPSFLALEMLETLANEDIWMEFQDINLGAWANKNLRLMATEADVKDVYDKYYDALSGYVHSNWTAVKHSVFGQCLNPLHRFHRVPLPPRYIAEDAVPDLVKFVNLSLDVLASLYSPFKPRLHLKNQNPKTVGEASHVDLQQNSS
jgi:hypothetical protein